MKVHFHSAAARELEKAEEFYEECRPGLGAAFVEEVNDTLARIVRFPQAWSPLSPNTRRCLLKRFPYGVIYQVKSGSVRVIAIAHQNRKPAYWRKRTRGG